MRIVNLISYIETVKKNVHIVYTQDVQGSSRNIHVSREKLNKTAVYSVSEQ
jgi:hypothetical protein